MRAAVLWKNRPIESAPLQLEQMPDPEPGPGEVVVRVHCRAICRTDLRVIEVDVNRVLQDLKNDRINGTGLIQIAV